MESHKLVPLQAKAIGVYSKAFSFLPLRIASSRNIAMSGIKPSRKNMIETDMYVVTANTSQRSGDLKLTHNILSLG